LRTRAPRSTRMDAARPFTFAASWSRRFSSYSTPAGEHQHVLESTGLDLPGRDPRPRDGGRVRRTLSGRASRWRAPRGLPSPPRSGLGRGRRRLAARGPGRAATRRNRSARTLLAVMCPISKDRSRARRDAARRPPRTPGPGATRGAPAAPHGRCAARRGDRGASLALLVEKSCELEAARGLRQDLPLEQRRLVRRDDEVREARLQLREDVDPLPSPPLRPRPAARPPRARSRPGSRSRAAA